MSNVAYAQFTFECVVGAKSHVQLCVMMMMMCEYHHVRKLSVCRLNGSCFQQKDCELCCNMSCRL